MAPSTSGDSAVLTPYGPGNEASDSLCSFENIPLKEKNSCIKMRNLANCAQLSMVL